ncbi:MAG: aminopeptidase [Spirochaetota bacterium]
MRPYRSSVTVILAALILAGAFYALDGGYLVRQGIGYFHTVILARDFDTLRAQEDLDKPTEHLLERVEEIRRFAHEELGLRKTENFTRYSEVNRDYLVTVVSVVRDDRMQRGTWNYPVVGELFYRGYYNSSQAQRVAARLEAQNYDVLIREVDAFSSLGYFPDPVYSFMSDYSDYRLANLIIHEEMHSTLWLEGQNAFNEEIATFVGDEGAAEFVRQKHGVESPEYQSIAKGSADRKTYRRLMTELHEKLSAAYQRLETRAERLEAKERIFEEFQDRIAANYDTLFRTDRYRGITNLPPDNARVDASYKYGGDLSLYYELYEEVDRDLSEVIDMLRNSGARPDAPRDALRSLLEEDSSVGDT